MVGAYKVYSKFYAATAEGRSLASEKTAPEPI